MADPSGAFAALLQRAREGDRGAMYELVQSYEPEVRMVARVRLGNALRPYLDSVDLVQSVHRTLMLGLRQDKFDISSPEKLVALALTLVRRKVARHWRSLRRQRRRGEHPDSSGHLAELLTSLSDSHGDPGRQAELHDQIDRVCRELNTTDRRLIELRLEGYSTAEAARTMGLDPDILRVRLSRLRKSLRARGALTDWL